MPRELHDETYMSQVINPLVVWRRQSSDYIVKNYTEYPIKQGKKIHDLRWIYGLYGALDGLSGSFSMLRYFFDVYYANSGLSSNGIADEVHDWMMTPVGMLVVGLEATVLVSVSIIANQFTRLKPEELKTAGNWGALKHRIVNDWPYIRDGMKALKNGYKGVRNVFIFANSLGVGRDLRYMIMPAGLILGAISAYNRPWLRKMRFERDKWEKDNKTRFDDLLKEMYAESKRIPEHEASPQAELEAWRQFKEKTAAAAIHDEKIFSAQSKSDSFLNAAFIGKMTGFFSEEPSYESYWLYAYISAAFNGLLDAPYLYLGVVSLTAVSPSLWIFGAAGLLSFICVITRLYEEHNLQREFLASQLNVKLALSIRRFTGLFGELKLISLGLLDPNISPDEARLLDGAKAEILANLATQMDDAQRCRDELKKQSVLSFWSLFMCGLKNGVESFGVVASVMFAIASVYAMSMTAYPPFLLTCFVVIGLTCLALFVVDSLLGYAEHLNQMADAERELPQSSMADVVQALSVEINAPPGTALSYGAIENKINEASDTLHKMMNVIPSRPYFYQYWYEVPRLFFSGAGKGIRIVDSMLVAWQALGTDGHYHDTDNMLLLDKISAIFVSIVFALRGFANASEKSTKQKTNARPVLGEGAISTTDSGADSPRRGPRRPSSPSGSWLSTLSQNTFFSNNTPNLQPSGDSSPYLPVLSSF